MILKEFQKRTLSRVQDYLECLDEWRGKSAELQKLDPDYDWVARAWQRTVRGRAYVPRKNGVGKPLPTFCLKIPTGGGKTLLAVKIVDLVNVHYRRRQTGLVLWIVPNHADIPPDLTGAEGSRPPLPAAARRCVRRAHDDSGEDQLFQSGRSEGEFMACCC